MLVELVGCSGAGKSTVARRAAALMNEARLVGHGPSVVLAPDPVLARLGLDHTSPAQLVNVVQDLAGLPALIRSWPAVREVVTSSVERIRRQPTGLGRRLLDVRSVARRVGMFERARRRSDAGIVLFDEGPVLSAYHLFAYDERGYVADDLDRFARSVPMPDLVVHVTASVPVLVERALHRADVRRQLSGLPSDELELRIARACTMFDELLACPCFEGRVLTVSNDSNDDDESERAAIELCRALSQGAPAGAASAAGGVR